MVRKRMPALCGMMAPVWFFVALWYFGTLRPDYSHFTKAVSELGNFGAPNALAWNVLGFGAVGLLIMIFAWGLGRQTGWRVAAVLVAMSGLGFAAAGVFPADMDNLKGPETRLHILASMVSLAAFALAVFVVGWALWCKAGWPRFALASTAFGIAAVLSVVLRETSLPPGLAQRINFLGYLLWIALLAAGTWKRERTLAAPLPKGAAIPISCD